MSEEYPPDINALSEWLQSEQKRIAALLCFKLSAEKQLELMCDIRLIHEKSRHWLKAILDRGAKIEPGPLTIVLDERGLPAVVPRNKLD